MVREKLARQAMAQGQMAEALAQVDTALKPIPPTNPCASSRWKLKSAPWNSAASVPSADVVKMIPEMKQQQIDIGTKIQNAKLLYEMGKFDDAEIVLNQVMKLDPANKTAPYYLDLVKEARYAATMHKREAVAKSSLAVVEKEWIPPSKQESLPIPNPLAHTNLVYTTQGRQDIISKLEHIRLNEVSYDLPLSEVLNRLRIESQKRDPDRHRHQFHV